jgi:hypothetical protein
MRFIGVAVLSAALAGCTGGDSHSLLPAFMRDTEPEPQPLEKPPEVAAIVREQLNSVFATSSSPNNVEVSPPHHDPRALDWIACVRANVISANGRAIGLQTYRIVIEHVKIIDRRRSDEIDNC